MPTPCPECLGKGKELTTLAPLPVWEPCTICEGSGEIES